MTGNEHENVRNFWVDELDYTYCKRLKRDKHAKFNAENINESNIISR